MKLETSKKGMAPSQKAEIRENMERGMSVSMGTSVDTVHMLAGSCGSRCRGVFTS